MSLQGEAGKFLNDDGKTKGYYHKFGDVKSNGLVRVRGEDGVLLKERLRKERP